MITNQGRVTFRSRGFDTEPNARNGVAGDSIQDGTQLSRGVEVDITANPFPGFNIVAGYAYNESKYTRADASVNGLRLHCQVLLKFSISGSATG